MAELATDIRSVTPKSLAGIIRKCIRVHRPLMVWGPPGVGKSDIVGQVASEQDRLLFDIRLLLMDPTDLKGIPFYNPSSGKMEWAKPSELPDIMEKPSLVFLDEINAAPQSVQAAAYQLILNRRIGDYKLPDNSEIIAAGNRETDKAVVYRMPSALRSRFSHIELKTSFDDWRDWGITNAKKIHPDVIGYLTSKSEDLNGFDATSNSRAFNTPRTWDFVSQYLWDDEENSEKLVDSCDLNNLIIGTIGEAVGVQFVSYRENTSQLPRPMDILSGKITKFEARIDVAWSLVTNLCYELSKIRPIIEKENRLGDWDVFMDNFLYFMMRNFREDMVVFAARTVISTYSLPINPKTMKSWDEFNDKYCELILGA